MVGETMICPLCGATLREYTVGSPAGDIPVAECSTPRGNHWSGKGTHYSISDYYGLSLVVLPYVINAPTGATQWKIIKVDDRGIAVSVAYLPPFKIPPQEQFINKLKTLLVFS
jgi:hypothetical protein